MAESKSKDDFITIVVVIVVVVLAFGLVAAILHATRLYRDYVSPHHHPPFHSRSSSTTSVLRTFRWFQSSREARQRLSEAQQDQLRLQQLNGLFPTEPHQSYREDLDVEDLELENVWQCHVCAFQNVVTSDAVCTLCATAPRPPLPKKKSRPSSEETTMRKSEETTTTTHVSISSQKLNLKQLAARRRQAWKRIPSTNGLLRWVRSSLGNMGGSQSRFSQELFDLENRSTGSPEVKYQDMEIKSSPMSNYRESRTLFRDHHHQTLDSSESTLGSEESEEEEPIPLLEEDKPIAVMKEELSRPSVRNSLWGPSSSDSSEAGRSDTRTHNHNRLSMGYVRIRNSAGEIDLKSVDDVRENPSTTSRLTSGEVVDLEHIACLNFQAKSKWFSSQLHRLWQPWDVGHAEFTIRRDFLLQDSLTQVRSLSPDQLRQRWRISFAQEPALDAGGIMREWITLLTQQLFDPKLGLFIPTSGSDTSYWINPAAHTPEYLELFALAGRVIGKCLVEEHILVVHLALPLLKHILAMPLSLSDLQFLDAELYANVNWLHDPRHTTDDIDALCLDFSLRRETLTLDVSLGKSSSSSPSASSPPQQQPQHFEQVELRPGGAQELVTKANCHDYIELLLKYHLVTGVKAQLFTFLIHFYEAMPEGLLRVFDYKELELILSGHPCLNLEDWRAHTDLRFAKPNEPTEAESENVVWFWAWMGTLDQRALGRLLQFVTGSSRAPSMGFRGLISNDGHVRRFNIVVFGEPVKVGYLPKAHTCFNRLDLPIYATEADLIKYLTIIVNADITGFTIE